jgi:hypothetical protein
MHIFLIMVSLPVITGSLGFSFVEHPDFSLGFWPWRSEAGPEFFLGNTKMLNRGGGRYAHPGRRA